MLESDLGWYSTNSEHQRKAFLPSLNIPLQLAQPPDGFSSNQTPYELGTDVNALCEVSHWEEIPTIQSTLSLTKVEQSQMGQMMFLFSVQL